MWDVAQVTGKAIAYGRKYTGNIRNGEVGALAWFFANGLRNLENRWNSTLDDTQVSLKGVFCHKSGNAGPVVDFHHALGGCELADILLILTQAGTSSGTARGNALFLQAKDHRWPLTGNSTTKQKFLYEQVVNFTFRPGTDFTSVKLGEHPDPGTREIPDHREAGFKFWFFEPFIHSRLAYEVSIGAKTRDIASSTSDPGEIDEPYLDTILPSTIIDFLVGKEGLGVSAPIAGDFGWNRIVRDVVKSSIGKAMAVPKKLDGKNPHRVQGWSKHALSEILADRAAVVANPFEDLAASLDDDEIRELSAKLAAADRHKIDDGKGGDRGPPSIPDDPGIEGPGGGSFIWIELAERIGQ
ncbi:MAG: hypothetical protein WCA95_03585 [Opitutaceae bacterium]